MTLQAALELAAQQYRAGRFAEAGELCAQILAQFPDHAAALQIQGLATLGRGDCAAAAATWQRLVTLQPGHADHHSNLSVALHGLGHFAAAATAASQATVLRPAFAAAHVNLGTALLALGRTNEAAAAFHATLKLQPDLAVGHLSLGNVHRQAGALGLAVASYRVALQHAPDYADAWVNLGTALGELGQDDEALAAFAKAIALHPQGAEIHHHLGLFQVRRGRFVEAVAAFRVAAELQPDRAEAHADLGTALAALGQDAAALAAFRTALQWKPGFAVAHFNLGNVFHAQGHLGEARDCLAAALRCDPGHVHAWINLGTVQRDAGDLDAALASFRRALDLAPLHAGAWNNLGLALADTGAIEQSLECLRKARDLAPDDPALHSNLIFHLQLLPTAGVHLLAEEKARWNGQHGAVTTPPPAPVVVFPEPERPLRIGYVSPDFRSHTVGRNVLPLLRNHDREGFEIFCYSDAPRPDALTGHFRELATAWRDTARLPHAALAERIREDRVDVLVDLALHTAGNRLPVFAQRPAPVQVSFAGYPGSTGLAAIESYLSDVHLEGATEPRQGATPCLLDCFWCFDPGDDDPAIPDRPAPHSGSVTFGSLNNFAKVNGPLLRLWARLLDTLPGARLILLCPAGAHRARTREVFGPAAPRVEFAAPGPRADFLRLIARVDIALDSFPYNGHTTSLEMLWRGVPVVTLAGESLVARGGLSQLKTLGLDELVAESEAEYLRVARHLARDGPRLAELRRTLRGRMESSPLMNPGRFARQIEGAYRTLWRRWCERNG